MVTRKEQLLDWVNSVIPDLPGGKSSSLPDELTVVSGDASFRKYYRATIKSAQNSDSKTYIAVDAPPEKEDSGQFVAIAQKWHQQGISVPDVFAVDLKQGFMLLEDFGDNLFAQDLDHHKESRYPLAIDALLEIQMKGEAGLELPKYDLDLLTAEMNLFTEWLIGKELNIALTDKEQTMFGKVFEALILNALDQPQVAVHRDYHSRNLMVVNQGLGIIDFQDAVKGPITYDLVSLLRDCYVNWPNALVEQWAKYYFENAIKTDLLDESQSKIEFEQFKKWFDWMGVQRHLKAAGIFARLHLRDGKNGYLGDIPNTVNYIRSIANEYDELNELAEFLEAKMPNSLLEDLI